MVVLPSINFFQSSVAICITMWMIDIVRKLIIKLFVVSMHYIFRCLVVAFN